MTFVACFFVYTKNTYAEDTVVQEEIDALTQEINEKKEKIKQIEQSITEYKKKIEEKRLQSVSLSNQLSILENKISEVELDIELTEEKIATIELELEKLKNEIETKTNTIEKQSEITAELIRSLYKNSDKNFIEVMAAYEDFSDFYNKLQYLKTIEADLSQNTKNIKIAKVELEEKQVQATERQEAYKELEEELENKRKDLEEQTFAKEDVLNQTRSSEMTYRTLVVNLKEQYQKIEGDISATEQIMRQKLEASKKLSNISENDDSSVLSWPTDSRYITSRFHDPDYPYRNVFEHNGIDIRASHGTPLRAAGTGYVARAKSCSNSSCYAYVMIIHPGGMATVYGHMSKIVVSEEQFVTRGDIIGYSGGTPGTVGAGPFVTGPHLHFEVRKNGIPVNPVSYLVQDW